MAFEDPEHPEYSAVVEDDGCVAYAYFLVDEKITGLVWLYNSANEQGRTWEESREQGLPPRMPDDNVKDPTFAPIASESELEATWVTYLDRREVGIYIRGKVHAAVGEGDYPGSCLNAIADSPMANAWVAED